MITTDRPGIAEQYISASNARDITVDPDKRTDADVLLAAGYAASNNAAASLALRFYRLRATGDMTPFSELAEIAGEWLLGRSMRGGRRRLRGVQARDLATRTMFWWLQPACKPCAGRGHPLMPHSPVINYGHDCPTCHGTGQYPIHRIVPAGTADEARWLVDELDRMTGIVFKDMARLLAANINHL
jgi:hypothetical protein